MRGREDSDSLSSMTAPSINAFVAGLYIVVVYWYPNPNNKTAKDRKNEG